MSSGPLLASETILDTFGINAVHFAMGAVNQLQLKNDATLFFTIEVILPTGSADPVIYQKTTDGGVPLAGVARIWRGIEIVSGGTPLAVVHDFPEEGLTTYTFGLMLEHMSEYILGLAAEYDTGGMNDTYGFCLIGNPISATRPTQSISLLVMAATVVVLLLFVLAGFWINSSYQLRIWGFKGTSGLDLR